MAPDQTIKQALKAVQQKLATYIAPGQRDCEETINS
jgi:hypothetical protein